MADQTAFAALRDFCDKNGCRPCFRAETFDYATTVQFSLSAIRVSDGKRLYDLRDSRAWDDAESAMSAMAQQAQAEWWPSV